MLYIYINKVKDMIIVNKDLVDNLVRMEGQPK